MTEHHVLRDHYRDHIPPGNQFPQTVSQCSDPVCQRYTRFMELASLDDDTLVTADNQESRLP